MNTVQTKKEQDAIIASLLQSQKERLQTLEAGKAPTRSFRLSSRPLYKDKPVPTNLPAPRLVPVEYDDEEEEDSSFRNRVTKNFGSQCAITGCTTAESLKVVRIHQYTDQRLEYTSNGILLDISLSVLFEKNLLTIDPKTKVITFHCEHPLADKYDGTVIRTPIVKLGVEPLTLRENQGQ